MTRKELCRALEELEIPRGSVTLQGGLPDNALTLDRVGKPWQRKKWEVYYSERGGKYDAVLFDTQEEACDHLYAMAKELEAKHRRAEDVEKWAIIRVIYRHKELAEVHIKDAVVEAPGTGGGSYFAVAPEELTWREPPEKAGLSLTGEEQRRFIRAVGEYGRGRKTPIVFQTEELRNAAARWAGKICDVPRYRRVAERALWAGWPHLPPAFLRACLQSALAWRLAEDVWQGKRTQRQAERLLRRAYSWYSGDGAIGFFRMVLSCRGRSAAWNDAGDGKQGKRDVE